MADRDFKGVWIPRDVWLAKDLSIQEKVLLVEIDSLSKTDKGCFASNEYFAEFMGLSKERARKVISALAQKGYVSSTIEYKPGSKEVDKRWLKVTIPYGSNVPHPMVENDHDNNTDYQYIKEKEISKDISQKKRFVPPTVEEVRAYCKERHNNVNAEQFVDYYSAKGWMIGKNKMRDYKAAIRLWERNDSNKKSDTWSDTKLPTW